MSFDNKTTVIFIFKNLKPRLLLQVLNNRMFNPRLGSNGEPKQEETNGNDHHVAENGEIKIKMADLPSIMTIFFSRLYLTFCLGEYKFVLPPDEEGMVYQCHLCSYSGTNNHGPRGLLQTLFQPRVPVQ